MNKTCRSLWNESTQTYITVAETAKTHGKGANGRKAAHAVVATTLALLGLPTIAWGYTGSCAASNTIDAPVTEGCTLDNNNETLTVTTNGAITTSGTLVYASPGISGITIVNDGTIQNTSTTSATAISVHGNNSGFQITNSGSITATTGIIVRRLSTDPSTATDSSLITNSGTISGSATGIRINGVLDRLVNSGTIISGGFAIDVQAGAHVNFIDNTGTISGALRGFTATLNLNGTSGRVTGPMTGGAINVNGTFTTENTFSTAGNVNIASGGILNLQHAGRASGSFTNAGTLNIGGAQGATAMTPGTLTATSFANVGALVFNHTSTAYDFAPLAISGSGTIGLYGGATHFSGSLSGFTGAMTVDGGTLHVAAGDNLTLGGSYTQSNNGTLNIGVTDSGYGKLVVTGAANLGGALFIDATTMTASHTYGNTIAGIMAAHGGISGTFSSHSDNSSLFDFTPVYHATSVDLTVTAAGGNTSAYRAVTTMRNNQAIGAANVLDNIFYSAPTGEISQTFYGLNGAKAVSDAVSQTLPLLTGSANAAVSNTLHGTNKVIQARQESNQGLSSGDEFISDKYFWFKPFGSRANQNDHKEASGYNANTYGLVFGADGELNDSNRIGVALSYTNSRVNGNSTTAPSGADIDSYQLVAYGSRSLNTATNLNWQADVGQHNTTGNRSIRFASRVARSDYDSWSTHIGTGLSRIYLLNAKTSVTPSVRADYTWMRDESYSETGAGALNLNVNNRVAQELILSVDGKLTHQLNDKVTVTANLGLGYNVLNEQSSITAAFAGAPTAAFTTKGLVPSPWLARGGLGLTGKVSDTVEVTGYYDFEVRNGLDNQTASAKMRWAF